MEIKQEVIDALKRQDPSVMSTLYDDLAPSLYGIVLRIVGAEDIAQDVVQETFIKAWRNGAQYDAQKGTLFTWFLNIARNTAIDKTRSAAFRKKAAAVPVDERLHDDPRHSVSVSTDCIGLRNFVGKLEEKYREVVELAYFQGHTQQEIAEKLSLPIGTVKSRVRIALRELRKVFHEPTIKNLFILCLEAILGTLTIL
jgi:RNA polymerase sigma-70 factor (ECF subfamily)